MPARSARGRLSSHANTAEALHDLTGRPVFDYNLEAPDVRADIREGRLWAEVCEHVQELGE